MLFHQIAGSIAAILAVATTIPYIVSILQKKTRPNRVTWLIFTINDFLIVVSYWSSGARSTIWMAISYTVCALLILVLSLKYGEQKWSKLDISCLISAGLSIIFWAAFHSAQAALLIQLLILIVGSLPTFAKAWRDPKSENSFSWVVWTIGAVVNMLAIEQWTFFIAIQPIVCFLFNATLTLIILWPRRQKTPSLDV